MDTATSWHLLDAVLAIIAGALAGGLTTRFLVEPYKAQTQERLAHVESNLTTEREERQALRDRVQSQEATKFDLLHEWRAKAMLETYAALSATLKMRMTPFLAPSPGLLADRRQRHIGKS